MKYYFTIIFFALTTFVVIGQEYQVITYSNEDGLPSNIIHDVIQDKTGFVWLASDAGIIRYDGNKFVNFNNNLPSSYVKNLELFNDNICLATDMGVGIIRSSESMFKYHGIIDGGISRSDSNVSFPKEVYVDKKNTLWIADMKDIYRISGNNFKKYSLELNFSSEDYKRSFSFKEDANGTLIITSFSGYLFRYQPDKDKIIKISFNGEGSRPFNSIKLVEKDLWVAKEDGIFKLIFSPDYRDVEFIKIFDKRDISTFATDGEKNIFFGTWNDGFGHFNLETRKVKSYPEVGSVVINSIFTNEDGVMFVATDNGISILKEQLFQLVDLTKTDLVNKKPYVRRLKKIGNNKLSFLIENTLYNVNYEDETRLNIKQSEIRNQNTVIDYEYSKKGIWVSHTDGRLELYNHEYQIIYKHLFKSGRLVFLFEDDQGTLWGFSYKNNQLFKISTNFEIEAFDVNLTQNTLIQNIKQFGNKIYFCGYNNNYNYLFTYDISTRDIEFLDLHKYQNAPKELHVFDFYVSDTITVLATNKGLIRVKNNVFNNFTFDHNTSPITFRSLLYNGSEVWAASDQGIYIWREDNTCQLKKSSGLPNSTISRHGILRDELGRTWAATASGLSFITESKINIKSNPVPNLVHLDIDSSNIIDENTFLVGSNLRLEFASFDYPTNRIKYSTKILGLTNDWQDHGSINFLNLRKIPAGDYTLFIKAKNEGKFWSEPTVYKFKIVPPWYLTNFMIVIYISITLLIAWYIIYVLNRIKIKNLEMRKDVLEKEVSKRTNLLKNEKEKVEELLQFSEEAKKELQKVNESNIELLNIIAHDLKNPIQSILGYEFVLEPEQELNEETSEIFKSIFRSSKKMNSLITEYLESAARDVNNTIFKFETTNINTILDEVIAENKDRAIQKDIKIFSKLKSEINISVDKNWMKIAFYNLISNAIKYSPRGKNIYVGTEENGTSYKISVKDEGPGISKEDQENLFKKFQRLSAKPTGNETATGLGLYIVKDIVEKHDGNVFCESSINQGSTFSILLPLNHNHD